MHDAAHIDPERIQRFLHGELSDDQRADVLSHLKSCGNCSDEVNAAKAEDEDVFGLIATLHATPPEVTAADIMVRGEARKRGVRRGWGRWAAATLLTLAGVGTAYAAPGSPIPEWLGGAFGGDPGAVVAPAPEPLLDEEPGSGILVDLAGDWTIDFPDPPMQGTIIVTVQDGPNISIRSSDVGSSFDWDVERVTVRHGELAAADFRINVPPDASSVEIRVRARTVWRRVGGDGITTSMDEIEEGVYHLRLDELSR